MTVVNKAQQWPKWLFGKIQLSKAAFRGQQERQHGSYNWTLLTVNMSNVPISAAHKKKLEMLVKSRDEASKMLGGDLETDISGFEFCIGNCDSSVHEAFINSGYKVCQNRFCPDRHDIDLTDYVTSINPFTGDSYGTTVLTWRNCGWATIFGFNDK